MTFCQGVSERSLTESSSKKPTNQQKQRAVQSLLLRRRSRSGSRATSPPGPNPSFQTPDIRGGDLRKVVQPGGGRMRTRISSSDSVATALSTPPEKRSQIPEQT